MRLVSFSIIFLVIFAGCSTNYQVSNTTKTKKHLTKGYVRTKTGKAYRFQEAVIESDSTTWVGWRHDVNTVSNSELDKVVVNKKGGSAGKGLLIGGGIGLGLGLLNISSSSDGDSSEGDLNELGAVLMLPVFIIGGGVIGLLSGGISGEHETYHFDEKNEKINQDEEDVERK